MEFIEKHLEKDWNWYAISQNKFLCDKKCAKYKIELQKYKLIIINCLKENLIIDLIKIINNFL